MKRRREFITLLGGAAIAWPLAASAQQPAKLPTIGFFGAAPSIESQRVAAFVQRLRELAWIDGRNLAIEYRWAEGRNERYAEIAADDVRRRREDEKIAAGEAVRVPPALASPRLLETPCSAIEQMRLVNALCWARAYAGPSRSPRAAPLRR